MMFSTHVAGPGLDKSCVVHWGMKGKRLGDLGGSISASLGQKAAPSWLFPSG